MHMNQNNVTETNMRHSDTQNCIIYVPFEKLHLLEIEARQIQPSLLHNAENEWSTLKTKGYCEIVHSLRAIHMYGNVADSPMFCSCLVLTV